jgi:hypothetical protein
MEKYFLTGFPVKLNGSRYSFYYAAAPAAMNLI